MNPATARGLGPTFAEVRRVVDEAAASRGRDPAEVTVIAVSKSFPAERVREALAVGHRDFGENRVRELIDKAGEVGPGPRWHFVGRLQRNKVRQVIRTGAVIHSVDRLELAREIDRRALDPVTVLVQVNLSGEPEKGGVAPDDLDELMEQVLSMQNLDPMGLMTMAARTENPEEARPVFRELARLREEVARHHSCPRIHHLSMGMSQDYRVAVEEGATLVRVGEAVFGPRAAPNRDLGDQLGESER